MTAAATHEFSAVTVGGVEVLDPGPGATSVRLKVRWRP